MINILFTYKMYVITPTDQQSTALPYGLCLSTSGAEINIMQIMSIKLIVNKCHINFVSW